MEKSTHSESLHLKNLVVGGVLNPLQQPTTRVTLVHFQGRCPSLWLSVWRHALHQPCENPPYSRSLCLIPSTECIPRLRGYFL